MQELTFEQVEVVSGGLASNGSDAPITNITSPSPMDMNSDNQFLIGNFIGGFAGAIAGGFIAIMHHSGKGTGEGTPLKEIAIGAACGFFAGFVSPANGVRQAAAQAGGYVGVGVTGYVGHGAGNPQS